MYCGECFRENHDFNVVALIGHSDEGHAFSAPRRDTSDIVNRCKEGDRASVGLAFESCNIMGPLCFFTKRGKRMPGYVEAEQFLFPREFLKRRQGIRLF